MQIYLVFYTVEESDEPIFDSAWTKESSADDKAKAILGWVISTHLQDY